ncbi:hypothetical protein CTI12_AA239690 [Artemisia annua]|uniref:Uncharacterized protein n=1 Tax=Artemisia annua TaxID=35608 RepID=A0A2U1NQ77_ARTAN|nr:hypothetical protein CTI12_AA239690 [Artemisia annua]
MDIHIETLSNKLNEMDRFAADTNGILNEMKQWVTDLVEETSRQRQCATDNEEELIWVKRDFESLKAHVSSLISVRETLYPQKSSFRPVRSFLNGQSEKQPTMSKEPKFHNPQTQNKKMHAGQ